MAVINKPLREYFYDPAEARADIIRLIGGEIY